MAGLLDRMRTGDRQHRNDTLMDIWSWAHFASGVVLGWIMVPFWALTLLIAWEPIEILILSPLLWKYFDLEFGYETLRNSLSDILFDAAGVAVGAFLLRLLIEPPFILFD